MTVIMRPIGHFVNNLNVYMDTIGNRLREERVRLGFNQEQFAELSGVLKRAQIHYEKNERHPNAAYLAQAAAIGADALYILSGQRQSSVIANADEVRLLDRFRSLSDNLKQTTLLAVDDALSFLANPSDSRQGGLLASDYIQVPRYDIRASAGGGSVIHDESIVDHLAFKRDWLTQSMGCAPEQVCVIQVRGDSMTPTINDADLLLLDMRQVNTRTEGVYVIQLQGSLLVKRLRFKVNGAVDVISDNTRYGIETLTSHEVNQLTVLGRVVWHGGKF
jgi:phage repressor protein C with HTH and peptisase S24 domain/DNA-binding XRE family transcriptional regulator